MCTFLKTHSVEEAGYYESRPGSILDLQPKPKSLAVYRACVVPLAGPLPFWARIRRGGTGTAGSSSQPSVVFVVAGKASAKSTANAPAGANELDVNFDPHTGVIASASWLRDGKAIGPVTTLPARATGCLFRTKGSSSPSPLTPPNGATGLHVVWDPAKGTIVKAQWFRVGSFLASIPVSFGQTAIALEAGG